MPFNEDGSRKASYKRTGFKMAGFSAFDKNDGLPEGFYDAYKSADKTNATGDSLSEQGTKTASTKAGKFVAVYS